MAQSKVAGETRVLTEVESKQTLKSAGIPVVDTRLARSQKEAVAISKETGIAESTLSRFMSGERGLPTKTLDRLADFLDLNILTGKRRRRKGR